MAHRARAPARWWGEPLRLRTLVLAALGGALLLPAGARADMVGTSVAACVPAEDLPTGPNTRRGRSARAAWRTTTSVGAASSTSASPPRSACKRFRGKGECHCVLSSIADLYGYFQAPLADAGDPTTFDWGARGTLAAPTHDDLAYDTSTYTPAEFGAYAGTTDVLDAFGDQAGSSTPTAGAGRASRRCRTT